MVVFAKENRIYEYSYTAYIGKQYAVKVLDDNTVITSERMLSVEVESPPVAISEETSQKIKEIINDYGVSFYIHD